MHLPDAKKYMGQNVVVTFRDRHGDIHEQQTKVHDISFVPMYGACLVGDLDDIWLDKVTSISAIE